MTTRANLYVDQGVDFLVSLELKTDDGDEYEITNQEFFCQVRKIYSTTIQFQARLEVIVNDITNELNFYIDPEDTKNIQPGKYQYDILMKKIDGETTKILEGLLFIIPTITKLE
jgi:hypothetical protein